MLTHLEYFINLAEAELPLAVQLVDVNQLTVNEEDGEPNDLKWIDPVNDITISYFLYVTHQTVYICVLLQLCPMFLSQKAMFVKNVNKIHDGKSDRFLCVLNILKA